MDVFADVSMCVNNRIPITTDMEVCVRMLTQSAMNTPDHVCQSETDQRQRCPIAAHRFECFHRAQRPAQPDPESADDDRTAHVSQPANQDDSDGLPQRPWARFRHGHKRDIMVGSQEGVDKPDGGCRYKQDRNIMVHSLLSSNCLNYRDTILRLERLGWHKTGAGR